MHAFGGAQQVQVRQFANTGGNGPRPNQQYGRGRGANQKPQGGGGTGYQGNKPWRQTNPSQPQQQQQHQPQSQQQRPQQFQQQQHQPRPFQQQNQFPQQQQQQPQQDFQGGYQGKPNNYRPRSGFSGDRGGHDGGGRRGGYDGGGRGRGRGRGFHSNQQSNFGGFQNKSFGGGDNQQKEDEMIDDSASQVQPQSYQQFKPQGNQSGFGATNNFNQQQQQQHKSQFYGQQKGMQNQGYGQQNQYSNYKGQNQQFKGSQNLDMGMDQDDNSQKQENGGFFGGQRQVTQSLSTNQNMNSSGASSGYLGFSMQNNTFDQKATTQSFGQNQSMTSTMQSTQPGAKQEPFVNTDPNKVLYFTEQQLNQFSNNQCKKTIMKENVKGPMDEFGFFSLAFNYYYNPQIPNQDPNLDYLPLPQDV